MPAQPGELEAELAEIERALSDGNVLHEKLLALQAMTGDIVRVHCNSTPNDSRSPVPVSPPVNTSTINRPCQCSNHTYGSNSCRRVCLPNPNQPSRGFSPSNTYRDSSSQGPINCCSPNYHTRTETSGSTIANCRINLNIEDTSSSSSPATSTGIYSSGTSQQQSSSFGSGRSRSRLSGSDCAQRLTELTFRVLERGFILAESSWLYEMDCLLKEILDMRQREVSCSGCQTQSSRSSGRC